MERDRKPIHEIRLGAVRAAIWRNVSHEHRVFFNVTISRQYRVGEQSKDAASFGRDDLPVVTKVADLAYAWIWNQSSRAPANQPNDGNAETTVVREGDAPR